MKLILVAAAASLALAGPAFAARPWETATQLVKAAEFDIHAQGLQGVGPHVQEFEIALAEGKVLPPGGVVDGDTRYVLTDGAAQRQGVAAGVSAAKPAVTTKAVQSPYPALSFYLGSYYDEAGRFADALRVLDAGLALDGGAVPGESQGVLLIERGTALTGLMRWNDAMANYERGLRLPRLADSDKGALHRGRGFALVEMGRLDEGEMAYNDALMVEPGDERAISELKYIASLKAGGEKSPVGLAATPKR